MTGAHRMHVVVRGRVQGVGFRWFVREEGRRLNLAGWVLNRRDGGVEVAAEGSAADIEALRRALEQGPDHAQVEQVEDVAGATTEALEHPFTIRR